MIQFLLALFCGSLFPFARLAAEPAFTASSRSAIDCGLFEEEPVEITLEKLMNFEWKQGKKLPQEIQDLDGKKVVIGGLMALGTLEGSTDFELVSDACGCGQSKMNHFVKVLMQDGETTGYSPNEVTVTGTFEIGEEVEDGFVISLFRLKVDKLEK